MWVKTAAIITLIAGPVFATPAFEVQSVPQHAQTTGWEHYVGGGLAVFDCDNGLQLREITLGGGLHNHLDMFKKRENIVEIEEGKLLSPKFDNDGLIPVITMCSKTKDVLMHGYMNVEAFKKTIETKEAHYFSRSRQQIWHKGKTSGFTQKVTEIRIDDDQDSIWLTVDIGDGSSCHVGYRSCFYRSIPLGPIENGREVEMKFEEKEKSFDPEVVYKGQPNPTKI